ncbi:MAG: pyruvate formate lyase family protein, partial [Candidatus Helarchaeota archaeon]
VEGYTTGTKWDQVWNLPKFGVVPEMYMFGKCFENSILATAKKVDLPEGFWNLPIVLRKATFFDKVMSEMISVDILKGELIIGGKFNVALSKCLTEEEAKEYKTAENQFMRLLLEMNNIALGNCGPTPGHIIPNYPKILRIGFKGVKHEIEEELKRTAPEETHKINQLKAMCLCCDTAHKFAFRYAEAVKELIEKEANHQRKKELIQLARICAKVPWEPAETFWEALQSLWFTHILVMADESYPGPGLSFGRIDQYLHPYYEKDFAESRTSRAMAKELLECFWIKCNYVYDYQGRVGNNQGINAGFGQLITLSGMGPNGEDLTNDLTYLMLEVIEDMNMLEPKPNVRLHKNTPDKLLDRITKMIAKAQGSPFLLNFDEKSIEGLRFEGLPESKLWDYAPVGCLENTLQGCDRSGTVDLNLNISKAIEFVLFNGKDLETGQQYAPETGDPLQFKSWDEFWAAYKKQIEFSVKKITEIYNIADANRAKFEPTPYLSLLVDGCIEKGLDVVEGGAIYNFMTVEGIGFATAVDSLLAIKKLVYETQMISLNEIIEAIKVNYEGKEALRQTLLNKAPKYGNDDDYADALAKDVNDLWTKEVTKYETPTHKRYRAGYLSWNYWVAYGPIQSATPDGRQKGTYLSNGICPSAGADTNGPTSVIKSVGKVGMETAPNGASHTMAFNPSLLRDAEHLKKFKALLRTYMDVGGTCLQVNCIDADTLRDAQKHPTQYRNLMVRVTGYNAYFTTVGRLLQDEIINRISHEI